MTDFTPEEALGIAEDISPAIDGGAALLGIEMPPGMPAFIAGMMLVLQEVTASDCACSACTQLRQISGALLA